MQPKPFKPKVLDGDPRYVRDTVGGLVWHRCKSRILYADTDRSQVVYHGNYLRYFELGRATLMRDAAYVGYPAHLGQADILDAFRQRFRPAASGPLSVADEALMSGLARQYPADVTERTARRTPSRPLQPL